MFLLIQVSETTLLLQPLTRSLSRHIPLLLLLLLLLLLPTRLPLRRLHGSRHAGIEPASTYWRSERALPAVLHGGRGHEGRMLQTPRQLLRQPALLSCVINDVTATTRGAWSGESGCAGVLLSGHQQSLWVLLHPHATGPQGSLLHTRRY
jgi:hypothetical protein